MSVVPMSPRSRWVTDPRGAGRGVRVSTHPEAGVLVLSVWKADVCVATTRLPPGEAAELVTALAESLAELAGAAEEGVPTGSSSAGSTVGGPRSTGSTVGGPRSAGRTVPVSSAVRPQVC